MSEWQPIETARRDGELIIVGNRRSGHSTMGYWDKGEREFNPDCDPCWRAYISGLGWQKVTELTDWMPFPKPPGAKGKVTG